VLLVLGLSGAGKSTLGAWLAEDLGLIHHEIDRCDGVDLACIRPEWESFLRDGSAGPLADALRAQAEGAECEGVVLTTSSDVVLDSRSLMAARGCGIHSAVLYGSLAECLGAFLSREAQMDRGLDAVHWHAHNDRALAEYGRAKYRRWRLPAFEKGARRSRVALVADVSKRIARGRI